MVAPFAFWKASCSPVCGFTVNLLVLPSGTVSLTAFYQRRARRILPAFYVFWAIAAGIEWFRGHPLLIGQLTASLFYYLNYYQTLINTHSTFIKHCWSLAVEKGLTLTYVVDTTVPEFILGDSTRMMQIVLNLVSNSVKVS